MRAGWPYRALKAAVLGDTATARRDLSHLLDRYAHDRALLGAAPQAIRAFLFASAGAWDSVPPLLAPAFAAGWAWPHMVSPFAGIGLDIGDLARALLGRAYERLGQPDSAVAVYEYLAAPHRTPLPYSFAHQRLAVLYATLGRLDDARRHYRVFTETFTGPDAEVAHLLDEARTALEVADGKARGR